MYYAQYGEDRILNQIFAGKTDGVCVEVGGFDGVTGSNTYFFEKLGWKCLIVEPMPDFCEKIRSVRNCDVAEIAASDAEGEVQFHVAVGVETLSTIEKNEDHFARIRNLSADSIKTIYVKTAPLDKILLDRNFSKIDFLTIDVEGHEMSVLSGMLFEQILPRIIITEDNTHGIDRRINDLMQSKSYIRFKKTGCNVWYVRKEDELATRWSRLITEIPISLYRLKLLIKPYEPAWMKRKPD
jgi:FkbM family methyltransferase